MERDERPVNDKGMEPVSLLLSKYIFPSKINDPISDGIDAIKQFELTEKCVKDVNFPKSDEIEPLNLLP